MPLTELNCFLCYILLWGERHAPVWLFFSPPQRITSWQNGPQLHFWQRWPLKELTTYVILSWRMFLFKSGHMGEFQAMGVFHSPARPFSLIAELGCWAEAARKSVCWLTSRKWSSLMKRIRARGQLLCSISLHAHSNSTKEVLLLSHCLGSKLTG